MTALTKNRATDHRDGVDVVDPVAAGVVIYYGAIVALDSAGNAIPAMTATGLIARGRAGEYVNNSTGATGDETVLIRKGNFKYNNDGSIDRTHIGRDVYIVDDQTLAATDGGVTRSIAGQLLDIESDGVWVRIK